MNSSPAGTRNQSHSSGPRRWIPSSRSSHAADKLWDRLSLASLCRVPGKGKNDWSSYLLDTTLDSSLCGIRLPASRGPVGSGQKKDRKRPMHKRMMALVVLCFLASLAYAQTPELPGWKLVWSDEFNYTGHPDPAKWGYEDGYVRHNELQYYTVNRLENARVDGHNLLIELRKETPQSFLPTSINDEFHRYTAASVNTRNTESWTYGRFEVMAKMPEGKGTWPAIWFLSPLRTPSDPGPP